MSPVSAPGPPATDPDIAATARLLHRRHDWNSAAIWGILALACTASVYYSDMNPGTGPGNVAIQVVLVLSGLLSVVAVAGYVADGMLLRRRPAALRDRAASAVLVLIYLVRLVRNWRRHRRQRADHHTLDRAGR